MTLHLELNLIAVYYLDDTCSGMGAFTKMKIILEDVYRPFAASEPCQQFVEYKLRVAIVMSNLSTAKRLLHMLMGAGVPTFAAFVNGEGNEDNLSFICTYLQELAIMNMETT